jgi:hypothetical protein
LVSLAATTATDEAEELVTVFIATLFFVFRVSATFSMPSTLLRIQVDTLNHKLFLQVSSLFFK